MYSGGDSADAQSYNQWALNPTTYQNMSNEQVDWAALAQQWIIMKEAGPPVPEPTALPQNSGKKVRKDTVEAGEAPMEVENDNDDPPQWNEGTGSGDSWKWQQNQQQQQWNWDNSWNNSPASAPKPPLLPTPSSYNQYSGNVDNASDNSNYGYNTPTSYQSGYWTASGSAKVIKPHNKRYSKVNVPTTVASTPSVPPKVVSLDAAKRKQLPAWIREGLEKMERDKLKQLDREREKQEKDENEAKRKLYEQNAMEILKDTVKEQQHVKSKFDSGSEESEDDIEGRSLTPEPQPAPPPRKLLNQEDMMVSVRRTMTEILLKVTNSEIYNICKEELERFQKKKKASEHRVSAPSGANLSAKLGLGAYGESDSENSEPDSNDNDSDAELKETIRRRKAEFVKIEKAIEEKLAASEKKEIVAVSGSRTDSPTNSDDKESQVDAKGSGLRRISHENSSAQHRSKISKRSSRKSDTSSDSRDSSKDRRSSRYSRRRSDSSSSSSRSRSRSRDHHHKSSSRSENRIGSDRSDRKYSTSDRKYPRRSSRSRSRRRRSESRSRSRSYRRSRSMSRSRRRSSSRSYSRRRRSGSRRRSDASSRRRRSRSYSSGRGKKSHRH